MEVQEVPTSPSKARSLWESFQPVSLALERMHPQALAADVAEEGFGSLSKQRFSNEVDMNSEGL